MVGVTGEESRFGAFVTSVKERTSGAVGVAQRVGEMGAARFDPSRRDAMVLSFLVFIIYLCGYFCEFVAIANYYKSLDKKLHAAAPQAPKLWCNAIPCGQYNSVAAGSFLAAFTALPLGPLIALRDEACPVLGLPLALPCIPSQWKDVSCRRWIATALCSVHCIGAFVFLIGMSKFIHSDNMGTPWYDPNDVTTESRLGRTTRQLLIPEFTSVCLVYLTFIRVTETEVRAMFMTLLVSFMTFWLFLTGFFIQYAHMSTDAYQGAASGVAAGSFFTAFTAPPTAVFSLLGNFGSMNLSETLRGNIVLGCTALHAVGYFIFFCSACSLVHKKIVNNAMEHEYGKLSFTSSQHLADVTLYIFMPAFFSVYFMVRSYRDGKALREGYKSVEGLDEGTTTV